jgi:2-polyprenyl-6-methoxyphenol hydroxylase-like FAD-dependent oxidoreductase
MKSLIALNKQRPLKSLNRPRSALIVGGGPAGGSVALALLGMGVEVTVLERRSGVGERVCGAFLGAEAIHCIDALGLGELGRSCGSAVAGVWVSVGSGEERLVNFPTPGLSLPRPELERMLLGAVKDRGGTVRWGVSGNPVGPSAVAVQGPGLLPGDPSIFSADLVVWADGRFSAGASMATANDAAAWYGWNATFSGVEQIPGQMSLYFLPDGYVGLLTFKDGTSNLCGLKRRRGSPLDWGKLFIDTTSQSLSLQRRMRGATLLSSWRGVGPLPFTGGLRPDDGRIRVGDAAAVGDPFMGEGIGRALASGPLLIQGWDQSDNGNLSLPTRFRHRWSEAYGRRFFVGNILRWALNHPQLSSFVLKYLVKHRRLLGYLLPSFHRIPHRLGKSS